MKATRINFDDMWDKYFDSYQGWLYVADCLCPSQERGNPADNTIGHEECNVTYTLSDPDDNSSDKFYSVDKDDYYIGDFKSENYEYKDEAENPDEIINTIQNKESENTRFIEDKEKNIDFAEDKGENTSHVEDKGKNTDSVKSAKGAKTEKIVRYSSLIKQPDDIIFECDTGLGFAFVTPKEESLIYTPPRNCVSKTLGTLSIDTTCLKNPKTKVLFSCNIYFLPRSGKGTSQLEFILSRSCNNCAESHMGNWIYDISDKSEHVSQTFKFNFCSCNSYPGFYNYFIRVIPVYLKNCSVLITNCHIDAFAQSK